MMLTRENFLLCMHVLEEHREARLMGRMRPEWEECVQDCLAYKDKPLTLTDIRFENYKKVTEVGHLPNKHVGTI